MASEAGFLLTICFFNIEIERKIILFEAANNLLLCRVAVERLALSANGGISSELEEHVGLLSTQQVVLLACGVDSWFVEHPRSTGKAYTYTQPCTAP